MKQTVNYLCVDDERNAETEAYLAFIQRQDERINTTLRVPEDFSNEVESLKREILEHNFNGLLLDLRLDGMGSAARYRAPALVQEIHTRVAENTFPARPLVLWSNDQKLSISYWPDDTSHDLFDFTIYKEKLAERNQSYAAKLARKLVALAEGYMYIDNLTTRDMPRVVELLNLQAEQFDQLDPRLLKPLMLPMSEISIYEQARFIHRQLLAMPNNALVDSEILAARLGIAIDTFSDNDFEALVDQLLPGTRYKGVFSEGWSCWWMSSVETVWQSLPDCPGPLRELTAEQRVAFINYITGRTDIKAAKPIELANSSSFWTICQITRHPLDPFEGYVADRQLYPWQLTQYVSLHGKLSGGKVAARIGIDALDWERYNEDKALAKGSMQ
jgi:hypothetical protein